MSARHPAAWVSATVPWVWVAVRDLDPRLDLVALLLPLLFGAGVLAHVVAGVARRRRLAMAGWSWGLALVVFVSGPWVPAAGREPTTAIRVVTANLLGGGGGGDAPKRLLGASPDLLVLQESAGVERERFLERLPYASGPSEAEVEVFSAYPFEITDLPDSLRGQRGMRVEVEAPFGDVIVYALHLDRPSPRPRADYEVGIYDHRRLVDAVRAAVEAETRPTLVVGDLNLVDRSGGYRALLGVLDDAMRAGWTGPTSVRWGTLALLARVDHVLMPEDWCSGDASTFGVPSSDHRGLVVEVGPC